MRSLLAHPRVADPPSESGAQYHRQARAGKRDEIGRGDGASHL